MAAWNTPLASRCSALIVAVPLMLACLLLTACGGDDYDPFMGLLPAPGVTPEMAVVGQRWSYQPPISSPDGSSVTVSASNLPDWMNLDPRTGLLEGIPREGDVRTWTNVQLTVNEGQKSTRLPALSVTVVAQGAPLGIATVSWSAPTERIDGSPIGELAGYRVLYGQTSRNYEHLVEVDNAGLNRYVIEGLGTGTWYFAVQAITSDGLTSAPSREVSKRI